MPTPAPGGENRRIAGRYRVLAELGSGSMGTVWSAYDEVLRRPVAVKEVRSPEGLPAAEAAALRERTMREARATAVLSHPNVVTLYDVVEVGGEPFVVMELVPSRSLASLIGEFGRLDVAATAAVGTAVAAALATAHRAGITHRDVKPGNVLVGEDGGIKLTDFGIARNAAEVTMTATGLVLGSPAYIAPEVAAGWAVTAAADLWGLGATLFAAVEGRPPYDAGDPVATVGAVVHGQVPRPSCGGPLAGVIAGLMVKEPDRRMGLDEVRRRLRPLLADPDAPVLPELPTRPVPGHPVAGRPIAGRPIAGHPVANRPIAGHPVANRPIANRPIAGHPVAGHPVAGRPASGRPVVAPAAPPRPARPPAVPAPAAVPGPAAARPLAADPGPLPFTPPPPSAPATVTGTTGRDTTPRRTRRWPLAVLALAVFVVGGVGGYEAIRLLVSMLTVAPAGQQFARHVDSVEHYGTGALGFAVPVPAGWQEFRLQDAGGGVVVRFVSLDGSRELRVERLTGWYPRSHIADFLDQLTGPDAARRLGVVEIEPLGPPREAGAPASGAREAPQQLSYRTVEAGGLARTTYLRLVPARGDLWVLRMTVPAGVEAGVADGLLAPIAAGFTPPAP